MRDIKAQVAHLRRQIDAALDSGDPDEVADALDQLAADLADLTYAVEKARDVARGELAAVRNLTDLADMSDQELRRHQVAARMELRRRERGGRNG